MSLIRKRDGKVISPTEIVLYGRSCDSLSALVLLDQRFLYTLRSLMACAYTFKTNYGTSFVDASTTDIGRNLILLPFPYRAYQTARHLVPEI